MDERYAEVVDLLSVYFDGLYHGDTARLAKAFHPDAAYICPTDKPMRQLTMGEYFPVVDARPSPASLGEPRADQIVAIEFGGPDMAFARVELAMGPKYFTDFLTLVRTDGAWRIISKVFHYDVQQG